MTSLSLTSPFATSHKERRDASEPYASAEESAQLLKAGAHYRRERIEASDMITTDEAAELAGTSRVTINAWIKAGRCIGVSNLRRGFKAAALAIRAGDLARTPARGQEPWHDGRMAVAVVHGIALNGAGRQDAARRFGAGRFCGSHPCTGKR